MLKKWKLIWMIIRNEKNSDYGARYNDWLYEVIKYALDSYEKNRGKGSAGVLLYDKSYGKSIIRNIKYD